MKQALSGLIFAFLSVFSVAGNPGPTPAGENDSKLAPVAFLTATDWLAKLPGRPGGKSVAIHAHFTWAENRQAIRVSNQFVVDGKPTPYIDGLYFWNPQTQKIEFVWSDAEGNLSRGTATSTDGKVVHDFEVTHRDGKSESFVARVTPQSDGSWTNEILAKKNGALEPFILVTYQPAKK